MTSIFKHIEKLEKIRRIQNKENEILIEEFCLYDNSHIDFENEI